MNKGGNDPLNHAVAYGRRHIAAWLLGLVDEIQGQEDIVVGDGVGGGGGSGGQGNGEEKRTSAEARDASVGAVNQREEGGREGEGRHDLRRRRRDDPVLLELARLTGDKKMEAFLLTGHVD